MYVAKDYDNLLGLNGLTDTILKNHFTLYQGYVNNLNKILDTLSKLDLSSIEYAELKRRLGWEFNGMKLHELFFENLSKDSNSLNSNLILKELIDNQYGSFENFEKEFKAISLMRGIGWAILYLDPLQKKLINVWINEHDVGHLADCIPLIVIDLFEHAYMLDYGLRKVDYVNNIFKAIDWSVVEKRLK